MNCLYFRSLEQQIEALTLYGVSFALLSNDNPINAAWMVVRCLILDHHEEELEECNWRKRRYLLEELVHNTSPTILLACLRNALQEDVRKLEYVVTTASRMS